MAEIQYALSGAVLEMGLCHHFSKLFEQVHKSNMRKTLTSETEAHEQALRFANEIGYEV